jgi:ABC-type multidrug transport system fused ATPase/permease subunit
MKKVKPGRGLSFIGFIGSIIAVVLGIFWLMLVIYFFEKENESGSPVFYFFLLFGIIFILLGIGGAIYNYINAFSKKRFPVFDIVEDSKEGDHFESAIRRKRQSGNGNYCPYCGNPVEELFSFCPNCGKDLKRRR